MLISNDLVTIKKKNKRAYYPEMTEGTDSSSKMGLGACSLVHAKIETPGGKVPCMVGVGSVLVQDVSLGRKFPNFGKLGAGRLNLVDQGLM